MTDASQGRRLSRSALGPERVDPPVRIVHLGLGAFHRAHQAWYTAHASDAEEWGIAAYTGRSPEAARVLAEQEGVYSLIIRGALADSVELVGTIVRAVPGADLADFVGTLAAPGTAVLTLTVTEAGYLLGSTGELDLGRRDVQRDARLLKAFLSGGDTLPPVTTALGRVLLALAHRRASDAPPLAVVPCDNLPGNGDLVRRALVQFAGLVSGDLAEWIPQNVSFVSTSVDRITPRMTSLELDQARELTGWRDDAPVVTEPFSDWVLSGSFPSGRPDWESAGARFVDDIEPWEARKLWLLNGAHTILACLGQARGHEFVAQAIEDPACRGAVEMFWDEACGHLPDLDLASYRDSLISRFANGRITHHLAQISQDTVTKLRLRVAPVALRERAAGRPAVGCATAFAAWVLLEGRDQDAGREGERMIVQTHVSAVDHELGDDAGFVSAVDAAVRRLERDPTAPTQTDREYTDKRVALALAGEEE